MEKDEPAFKINECSHCSAEIIDDGYYCDVCSMDKLCESCIGDHECDYESDEYEALRKEQ